MVTSSDIERALDLYCDRFPRRMSTVADLRALIRRGVSVTSRRDFQGHVTCGALVLDEHGKVLAIHHRVLRRWLMPGGHLEIFDSTLASAASRELSEELGIPPNEILFPKQWNDVPVDIDRHTIPENLAKSEPMHEHWDFRFLMAVSGKIGRLQLDEVSGAAWVDPDKLSDKLAAIISEVRR